MASQSRKRQRGGKPVPITRTTATATATATRGNTALAERRQPEPQEEWTLEESLRLLEAGTKAAKTARRLKGGNATSRAFSLAWDETEAMGITADMRRSGPGMLSDQDRKETLYQAYLNNVWISACVDVIAKRITSGGMVIELTEKGTENQAEYDTLHDFLHFINEDDDFLQLVRSVVTDILIYGEAYVEIVRKNGVPYSLHKIDCSTMTYKLDQHGTVLQYIQNMTHSTDTVTFDPDDVIRWWLPDPKAGKKALSPIERILGSIDADAHMADWVRSFFRKGARPPFWIQFPGSKEEASRFVVWLRENYTGQANAHIPMVLYDNANLHEIGKGAIDMDFAKGRSMTRQEVLAGYQVPPAIVSQIESGNIGGGTGESQDKSFQFNACDPVRSLFFEKFNYRLVKKGFAITNYQVNTRYADFRSDGDIVKVDDTRIRNGSATINEIRAGMGRAPIDGGDEAVIVTTKEIQPVQRLQQLADEQTQQTQTAIAQAQAQLEVTKAQAEKLKNPPPPPPTPIDPQAVSAPSHVPPGAKQSPPTQDDGKADTADTAAAQERSAHDLQHAVGHVTEVLTRADEHLRMIRMHEAGRALNSDEHQRIEEIWRTIKAQEPFVARSLEPVHHHQQPVQVVIQTDKQVVTHPPFAFAHLTEQEQEQEHHTGMMLAFKLDPETATQLALPGGEDPLEMHITLAYLGDMEQDLPDGTLSPVQALETLKALVSSFASTHSSLTGQIGGLARFTPSPSSDGRAPVIALVNVPGLQAFRAKLVAMLADAGFFVANNFDYTPHITLAYINPYQTMPINTVEALPLELNSLLLAIGDDCSVFHLGTTPPPDDGKSVESTLEEAKPALTLRQAWQAPSSSQLALERDLAQAIKTYIGHAAITKAGVTLPDEGAQDQLHEALFDTLNKAVQEGRHGALRGSQEESLVSAAKNLAGRAVDVLADIVAQLQDKAQDLIASIFGSDDVAPEDAQAVLDDQIATWAESYSEMVAETEVHAAIEGAVLDEMQQAGLTKKRWLAEPDACELCLQLAEAGPVDIDGEFEGGVTSPPLHPRCRCQVTTGEE